MRKKLPRRLTILGPGILIAATGIGAGDLATGAFTGSKLGAAVLWAVVLGAGIKYLLNEGLARWQLATGSTLLEGCVCQFGRAIHWCFLIYLLIWSFFVGSALMSACGVTAHAMVPIFSPETDKILYGMLHSALAVVLVKIGGYRLFGKVMSICIGMMVVVVVGTAVAMKPSWAEVGSGLLLPTIPPMGGEGLEWTIALIGGIGGTLTVLCYGYWIREEGRHGAEDLRICRIDLASGYTMTALFGMSMVVIGARVGEIEGGGSKLIVNLAEQLRTHLGRIGPTAKWAFLVGAWGAVFSSLLGVWQSVPYLFADFWHLTRRRESARPAPVVDTRRIPYQAYLFALAIVPAVGLWTKFVTIQKLYAIIGALFIPMLALALLILNGRTTLVGKQYRNSRLTSLLLVAAIAFFVFAGWIQIRNKLF